MRTEKNGNRYFAFSEVPLASKPKKKRNYQTPEERENSRRKFSGTCRVCGGVLSYVAGTNVMVCKNPDCKGYTRKIKNEEEDEDRERVEVFPVFRFLDNKGVEIAQSLFDTEI